MIGTGMAIAEIQEHLPLLQAFWIWIGLRRRQFIRARSVTKSEILRGGRGAGLNPQSEKPPILLVQFVSLLNRCSTDP